jgi:hypothetical protein
VLDLEQASGQVYMMDQSQSVSERSWAAIWREAGRELEVIRRREINDPKAWNGTGYFRFGRFTFDVLASAGRRGATPAICDGYQIILDGPAMIRFST